MDTTQFFARVVAPGGFYALAFIPTNGRMTHRFFTDASGAAGFVGWCNRKGFECWHALGSYKFASPDGQGKLKGRRTQDNVQALKSFWIDIDVKRAGDKKDPASVYADRTAALTWFKGFLTATGIPLPNLGVNSGYGYHMYWVLDDPMMPGDWQPYAEALKAALIQHGALVDMSVIADSARILRPPGSFNHKDPANLMPVEALPQLLRGDYPVAMMMQALQPFVGLVHARPVQQAVNQRGGSQQGGSSVSALSGPAPAMAASISMGTTQAAQEGPTNRHEFYFAEVAKRCDQAKLTMTNNGATDNRSLWYLGWMTLLPFCKDGDAYKHEVGNAHPHYDKADTEAQYQQAKDEHDRKGNGAPLCMKIDGYRPGVCPTCPHFGKINSPVSLGVPDGQGELPTEYRLDNQTLEHWTCIRRSKDGDVYDWRKVVAGEFYAPMLDRIGEDRKLTFTYEHAKGKSTIAVLASEVPTDGDGAMKLFTRQGMSDLYADNAQTLGRFLVSWINKLREMRLERNDPTPAFGWAMAGSKYNGLSVGGTCYRPDGTQEPAPGGDKEIVPWYKPRGALDIWRDSCNFVIKNRPDLQVLVAAAFAAPLVEFTGHNGFIMSAWSRDSAVGKSSALAIGTSVWGTASSMFHLTDTANSIVYRIGQIKVLPAYWDEIKLAQDEEDTFVDTLFQLGQGKEKARLNSDSTLKTSGEWKTILVTTGNRPLMDVIIKKRTDTDAGAVRLFEFLIEHPQLQLKPEAQRRIASAGLNSGNAGRIYAAHLAQNYDAAISAVTQTQEKLQEQLQASQQERFYIAGMACVLMGAFFAKGLGLAEFDIPAMNAFLQDAFHKLREGRHVNLPVNNGSMDTERIIADFIADHSQERLLTDTFAKSGPTGSPPTIIWAPVRFNRLAIHTAQQASLMRFDYSCWKAWCFKRGYSPTDALRQIEKRWGARRTRVLLGAGTPYASGKVEVIEIPLTSTELEDYKYSYDNKGKRR